MNKPKAVHYTTEGVIASSKYTTLKHAVPGKCLINALFLVTSTFSQTNVLKLTVMSVHTFLFSSALV